MSKDNVFDGSSSDNDSNTPLLTNNGMDAAAWLEQDKNGDAYLSVSLPLGLGTLNLFGRSDGEKEALNKLYEHINNGGR